MSAIVSKTVLDHIFSGTDCIFIFPDAGEKFIELHANRQVIDQASGFLKNKFETYKRNTLIINDVPESIFKMILTHIYTNVLPATLTKDLLFQMYEAALKYEVKCTMDALTFYMVKECRMENVKELLAYLNFALKHYIIEVQNAIQKIIEPNPCFIFACDTYFNAHPRVINWIFSLDDLNIDEWDLIDIAEKYKTFHTKAGRLLVSSQIQPAINNIRFLSMTATQVAKTSFLSHDEKKCLIQVIRREASDKSVPMYFNRHYFGRCNQGIKIMCDDDRLKTLVVENKVKLCTFKEKKYFLKEDGKILASVEASGHVVFCEFQELTPIKECDVEKNKKGTSNVANSVLYYKENKTIVVEKKSKEVKNKQKQKEKDEALLSCMNKLSFEKN